MLDVRERDEWEPGHIPGSVHVPYHDLHAIPDGIDPTRPVAGDLRLRPARRPSRASLLKRLGARDVIHVVDGGVPRWQREGWPIERY